MKMKQIIKVSSIIALHAAVHHLFATCIIKKSISISIKIIDLHNLIYLIMNLVKVH